MELNDAAMRADPRAALPTPNAEHRILLISGRDAATTEYWATQAGAATEDRKWGHETRLTAGLLSGTSGEDLFGETTPTEPTIEWIIGIETHDNAAEALAKVDRDPQGPMLVCTTAGALDSTDRYATGLAGAARDSRQIGHWAAGTPEPTLNELHDEWRAATGRDGHTPDIIWFRDQLVIGERRFGAWRQAWRTALAVQRAQPDKALPRGALAAALASAAPDTAISDDDAWATQMADAVAEGEVAKTVHLTAEPRWPALAQTALQKTWRHLRLLHDLLAAGLHHAPTAPRVGLFVAQPRRQRVSAQLPAWLDARAMDPMLNTLWLTAGAPAATVDAEAIATALTLTASRHPQPKHGITKPNAGDGEPR